MQQSLVLLATVGSYVLCSAFFTACGDNSTGAATAGGAGGQGGVTSTAVVGAPHANTGVAGSSQGGGTTSSGVGAGGPTIDACESIFVNNQAPTCAMLGDAALTFSGTTDCAIVAGEEPIALFAVQAEAGDCLAATIDNIGSAGIDTFGFMLDSNDNFMSWDNNISCAVSNPDGQECAAGQGVAQVSGIVYVGVGAHIDSACIGNQSYTLDVALNGVAVDLSAGPLCSITVADLQ